MGLTRQMLELIDSQRTHLAPDIMYEPVSAYTSPDVLERERRRIFGAGAHFLGLSASVPSRGSWRAVDVVDTPLLLWRDKAGRVRLYLNSCRHRGTKIVDGAGQARRLSCPFHAWTYDLDGRLVAIPEPEGFDQLSRSDHGLIELPVAEKYGMIFGSPVPGRPLDVDDILGGLGPELGSWGFESWSLYTEPHLHTFRGNWKFAWATFCENYHFPFLHKKTLSDFLIGRRQLVNFYGDNVRMVSALTSIETMRTEPEDEWDPARHLSIQYRLYPAVNFSVFPTKLEVHWVFPGITPDEGYGIHAVYVAEEPVTDEERKALDDAVYFGCEIIVNGEDYWVTGQSLPGLHAPAAVPHLVFGRNEPVVQHFHTRFRNAISNDCGTDLRGGASP
jgi:phenylpropionate dioxygenase-like ring-hydroxylating dioxygenase large terminal subunit